ncbi:probable E3 ubiquitin ligase complex SCF subunit sconB [Ananas comosus]|uniref:Probable E3 ubiquitin ligase complex SCF subunit sconB n=1 Tax=Ananas comosus TaxID=4615 RepID=A0A6P5FNN2_ANACO|nr:probable E3 ubiquitin ligase complex SCF subunit sconB [Ananas comosus]
MRSIPRASYTAMADGSPPPPVPVPVPVATAGRGRTLEDLDADALAHCARLLGPRDVAAMAMASKPLRAAAYSDSVWSRLFTERWPYICASSGALGVREQYIRRHTALQQMKFDDPLECYFTGYSISPSHIMLDRNDIFVAQGSIVQRLTLDLPGALPVACETLRYHGSRITCMRLFPIINTSLFRNEAQNDENVLVTSSSDRTIRLWWKGRSHRCFKGHNGPITALSDKLLGDGRSKVLASGAEDCTIRLWSLTSSGKIHPLTLTYHGHEKPLSFLSVAWHKASLLVSISKDSKVRVWDTSASSSSSSSSCVGSTSLSGSPIAMKCYESLCYIASGFQVTVIDLRTMRKAFTAAVHGPKMYSFEMLPSKWLICTGGEDKAMLWDIRRSQESPKCVAELDSNSRVALLHMDPYKVVTGGPFDYHVNVWETGTGALANTLDCRVPGEPEKVYGLSAMAVAGCRIVTGGCADDPGALYYRDFTNCSVPVSSPGPDSVSKFWEPRSLPDD